MFEHGFALLPATEEPPAAARFAARAREALTLDALVGAFRDAAHPEGMRAHRCSLVDDGGRTFLFGDNPRAADPEPLARPIAFPIGGWDAMRYEAAVALLAGPRFEQRRARLHAMASLYVFRGVALLDAEDDLSGRELTAIERFCLQERGRGRCGLDIAEDLDRSVHAVAVHLERAERKLRR